MEETNNPREQFESDVRAFALKYSLTRLKLESPFFDRDYKRTEDGALSLVSEKAIVRALGKTTKVPIGDDQKHKTYEEAEAYARAHWSAYFKKRREQRSDRERQLEAKRQKRYRERRKQEATQFKRQQ